MRSPVLLLSLALLVVPLAGCLGGSSAPSSTNTATCTPGGTPTGVQAIPTGGPLTATIETSMGNINVQLDYRQAPVTVANFLRYADQGFYDGTIFHRVVKGFVVQGGGFTSDLKQKPTLTPIPLDVNPNLTNQAYTLSMARTNNPNSATSQFFINLVDNANLDGSGQSPGYAVFGKVVAGQGVVDRMGNVSVTTRNGMQDVPVQNITIQRVDLHLPSTTPAISVVPYLATYCRSAGTPYLVPFEVRNGWDAARTITLAPTDANDTVHSPLGTPLELAPGATGLVLVDVHTTPPNGSVGLRITSGNLTAVGSSIVGTAASTGPAAGATGHQRTQVRYLGVLRTGVPFDTNVGDEAANTALEAPYGTGQRSTLLPVWVGNGSSPDSSYIQVIPGFETALRGLHVDQTTVAYTAPAQAYRDNIDRWFYIDVVSVN